MELMGTGCNYVQYYSQELLDRLIEIADAQPERWYVVLPKLPSKTRLEFGMVAFGHPIKKVWVDKSIDGNSDIILCAEW